MGEIEHYAQGTHVNTPCCSVRPRLADLKPASRLCDQHWWVVKGRLVACLTAPLN